MTSFLEFDEFFSETLPAAQWFALVENDGEGIESKGHSKRPGQFCSDERRLDVSLIYRILVYSLRNRYTRT
jgi:hypothetical protein